MHTSSSTNDRIRIGSSSYWYLSIDSGTAPPERQGKPSNSSMASVAQQPAAATSMMARVDRLDLVLSYLEELHHQSHPHHHHLHGGGSNVGSSSPSTPTTHSADSSPRGSRSASWRRACRPAQEVLEEAHAKGSLVDRIAFLEDRVLKMEEDMEITPESDQRKEMLRDANNNKKKGLKSLVKSCVRGKLKTKD